MLLRRFEWDVAWRAGCCGGVALMLAASGCGGSDSGSPIAPPPSVRPQIFVGSATFNKGSNADTYALNVFAAGASGNAAPIVSRTYPQVLRPFSPDASGAYWLVDFATNDNQATQPCAYPSGVSHYDALGHNLAKVLVKPCQTATAATVGNNGNLFVANGGDVIQNELEVLPCSLQDSTAEIDEYGATAMGQASALKTINVPSTYGICEAPSIATDSRGNIWLGEREFTAASNTGFPAPTVDKVIEFAATASGMANPIRTIALPAQTTVGDIATDASDNLYLLENTTLYRAPAGGGPPTPILSGVSVNHFAIGDGGHIIAEVPVGSQVSLEEFVPGNRQANRVISGTATQLNLGGPLAVLP